MKSNAIWISCSFSVKYVGIYLAGLADREVILPLQTVGEMFSVMC